MAETNNNQKINSKEFAVKLVENNYILNDEDIVTTNLVFSSEWINPNLYTVENYHFKLNYIINLIICEMEKFGIKYIYPVNVKMRAYKKRAVVYHMKRLDNTTNRMADYFFIVDSKEFKSFVFKKFEDIVYDQDKFHKDIKILKLSEISLDDFFDKALSYIDDDEDVIIKTEAQLLKEIQDRGLKLHIYVNDKKLNFLEEKIEVDVPIQRVNQLNIRLISSDKPIIDTQVDVKLEANNEIFYNITGNIVKEKTISFKKFYQLDPLICFQTKRSVLNSKAILTYIKFLKNL